MKQYKVKNKTLAEYLENDEAIEAEVGNRTTALSLEDIDIIIERVLSNHSVLHSIISESKANGVCQHEYREWKCKGTFEVCDKCQRVKFS